MKMEFREKSVVIDGYVNAVERFSKPLTGKNGKKFIEKIMPNVFQRAIDKNDDIKVLLNHNHDRELASTGNGTAELYEDNIGLRAIVEISDEEVIEKAKKNKLRGWSFGFICNKQEEATNENGINERTVKDIDLFEVSIIDDKKIPAYIGTSIEMRDGDVREIEFRFDEELPSTDEKENNNSNDVPIIDTSTLTSEQKRSVLSAEYKVLFKDGYMEDYDDKYVYGSESYETPNIYKMPYTIVDGKVNIDTTNKTRVIRGGYQEVRNEPEQQPEKEVEKIDYSLYEKRIRIL